MNQNPLISIIVPSYNHGHLIHRALNSILAQTYLYWEVIIVDNHSSDDTEKIVSNFSEKRFRFYKINNNGVIAASRQLPKWRWHFSGLIIQLSHWGNVCMH